MCTWSGECEYLIECFQHLANVILNSWKNFVNISVRSVVGARVWSETYWNENLCARACRNAAMLQSTASSIRDSSSCSLSILCCFHMTIAHQVFVECSFNDLDLSQSIFIRDYYFCFGYCNNWSHKKCWRNQSKHESSLRK